MNKENGFDYRKYSTWRTEPTDEYPEYLSESNSTDSDSSCIISDAEESEELEPYTYWDDDTLSMSVD
jgi:hypothetical protein